MSLFLSAGELPWRVAVEKMPAGGLWFSTAPDFARARVAIVGTRNPEQAALEWTRRFATSLAQEGIDVVSGGALGIDTAAHEGGLAASGGAKTWLVSPAAFGTPHPIKRNDGLFERVARDGVLLSQFAPGTPYRREDPKTRNGLLMALVDAVVLVQGGAQSGTCNAATKAAERSVPCFVLSGPLWSRSFDANRINASKPGARWVHSEAELWGAIHLAVAAKNPNVVATPELTTTARALLDILASEPKHLDEVAEQSGLPMAELAPVLLTLSLENVVKEGPAGFWAIGSRSPGNTV